MTRFRLRAKMRRFLYPSFGRNIGVYRFQGLSLLLRTQSRVDRRVIEAGAMEPEQVAGLTEIVKLARKAHAGPAVFFDIGAYYGFYALTMRRLGVFDRIIAFEPDAMNFAQLGAQLYLNDAAYDIEARRAAVSDRTGQAQMPRSVLRKNRGASGLDSVAAPEHMQTVDTIMLDDAYAFTDSLIVAKIDVEGHQAAVLSGMKTLIARNSVLLQMEAHEAELDAALSAIDAAGLTIMGRLRADYFATNISGLVERARSILG